MPVWFRCTRRESTQSPPALGSALTDFSAGLSCYIDATSKVMLNYIFARPEDQGSANIVVLRVQFNPWQRVTRVMLL
jgi:hypothetical protein